MSSHRQRLRDTARVIAEYRRLDAPARAALKQQRRSMPSGPVKLRTTGLVHPKVPAQALTTLAVAALAHFGLDIDDETSAALGVVLGFVAGYFAPAVPALPSRRKGV